MCPEKINISYLNPKFKVEFLEKLKLSILSVDSQNLEKNIQQLFKLHPTFSSGYRDLIFFTHIQRKVGEDDF